MTRVALIGAGFISRMHSEGLHPITGVRLAAVIDAVPEFAQAPALEHNVPRSFPSVQDALAADVLDRAHPMLPARRDFLSRAIGVYAS